MNHYFGVYTCNPNWPEIERFVVESGLKSDDRPDVMLPQDGDVHIVPGVSYNLSREYEKSIESLQIASKLKP